MDFVMLHLFWVGFLHLATIVSILLTFLFVAQILRSPRMPSTTMGWLLVIILIPIIGIPLYLTFGVRKLNARLQKKNIIDLATGTISHHHTVDSLLGSLGIPFSSHNNLVNFHKDGTEAWHELLLLLKSAQHVY